MYDGKRDFMSVEFHEGKVMFQYDLGSNRARLISEQKFNDGKWHIIEAQRKGQQGVLFADGVSGEFDLFCI